MIQTLYWENNKLYILNQLLLPAKIRYICCKNYRDVAKAIKDMAIRGAPAIGVAAAFGIVLALQEKKYTKITDLKRCVESASEMLASTRPTAVNLFWAIERMKNLFNCSTCNTETIYKNFKTEALNIYKEDIEINQSIGLYGASLLKKNSKILTHCNAGALATAGYGTALGVIRSAYSSGKIQMVFVDETRPYLQGARLTAFEMKEEGIPYCLITDNMAGHIMKTEAVNAVIVGADRIAVNGDTANKIGTYSLSILAKYHKIPFYIVAPTSTIDFNMSQGDKIVIEERSSKEVLYINGRSIAPYGTIARHPGFDVTPAKNITAIITEKGIFKPQEIKKLNKVISNNSIYY